MTTTYPGQKESKKIKEVLNKLPGIIVTNCGVGDGKEIPITIYMKLDITHKSHLGINVLDQLIKSKFKKWSFDYSYINDMFQNPNGNLYLYGPIGDYTNMGKIADEVEKIINDKEFNITKNDLQIGDIVKIKKLACDQDYERQSVFTGTKYSSFVNQTAPIIEMRQLANGNYSYTVGIANEASIHSFPRDCLIKVGVNEKIREEWMNKNNERI